MTGFRHKRLVRSFPLAALVLVCSCNKPAVQKQPAPIPHSASAEGPTLRAPTATEVFDLQSKCAELGRKIITEKRADESADRQGDEVSRYNPLDNHCYVEYLFSSNNQDVIYLYDGQTKELLATVRYKDDGERVVGTVYDRSLRKLVKDPALPKADEVRELIDKLIGTDRHP